MPTSQAATAASGMRPCVVSAFARQARIAGDPRRSRAGELSAARRSLDAAGFCATLHCWPCSLLRPSPDPHRPNPSNLAQEVILAGAWAHRQPSPCLPSASPAAPRPRPSASPRPTFWQIAPAEPRAGAAPPSAAGPPLLWSPSARGAGSSMGRCSRWWAAHRRWAAGTAGARLVRLHPASFASLPSFDQLLPVLLFVACFLHFPNAPCFWGPTAQSLAHQPHTVPLGRGRVLPLGTRVPELARPLVTMPGSCGLPYGCRPATELLGPGKELLGERRPFSRPALPPTTHHHHARSSFCNYHHHPRSCFCTHPPPPPSIMLLHPPTLARTHATHCAAMEWGEGDQWMLTLELPPGRHEYKVGMRTSSSLCRTPGSMGFAGCRAPLPPSRSDLLAGDRSQGAFLSAQPRGVQGRAGEAPALLTPTAARAARRASPLPSRWLSPRVTTPALCCAGTRAQTDPWRWAAGRAARPGCMGSVPEVLRPACCRAHPP